MISNSIKQKLSHPLLRGTFILTCAGLVSRLMGFFYRIFLNQTIGASGLGLYQLIFPVFGLCLAIAASGIQTAISRFVAASKAQAKGYLWTGLFLSVSLALIFSIGIYALSPWLAEEVLKEPRCKELLRLMAFSIVPACVHSCFNGYYYGKKNSAIPAISQIVEQLARVGGTLIIFQVLCTKGLPLAPIHAVWGLVLSELAGFLLCVTAYAGWESTPGERLRTQMSPEDTHTSTAGEGFCLASLRQYLPALITMAVPLSLNHVLMTLSHSLEHMLLPQKLMDFGFSTDEALAHFGILTGMSMSVIFFPAVVTNSLSVLLLPRIAEAKAASNYEKVWDIIKSALCCGGALGALCTFVFLFSSEWIGEYILNDSLAGFYVQILSILCPFMYTANLLSSLANGLGCAAQTLICNLAGCGLRLLAIWYLVPGYGMYAYIGALIVSEMLVCGLLSVLLRKKTPRT